MKWKRNLKRLHELKKKEKAMKARSQTLANRHKTALVNLVAMQREIELMPISVERLPYLEDRLARERQMKRRTK
jgi:hypothetical protein